MTKTARVPEPDAQIPRPSYMAHIVLRTARLEAMRRWYQTVLGCKEVMRPGWGSFLTFDDEHHRILLVEDENAKTPLPKSVTGLDHIAFTYGSLGDLIATYERLKKENIAPYRSINHGPTTSFYYEDPDRNRVELQVDNFKSVDALNRWMATGAYDREPVGVEIDGDDLARRYHAGEEEENLLKPLQE